MYFHIDGQRISIGIHKYGSLVGADYRIRARTPSTTSSSTSASESRFTKFEICIKRNF